MSKNRRGLVYLLCSQSCLQIMKRNVLGVAASVVKRIEHALRADVVERVNNDCRITLAVWVSGEPGGDGISSSLIIGCF